MKRLVRLPYLRAFLTCFGLVVSPASADVISLHCRPAQYDRYDRLGLAHQDINLTVDAKTQQITINGTMVHVQTMRDLRANFGDLAAFFDLGNPNEERSTFEYFAGKGHLVMRNTRVYECAPDRSAPAFTQENELLSVDDCLNLAQGMWVKDFQAGSGHIHWQMKMTRRMGTNGGDMYFYDAGDSFPGTWTARLNDNQSCAYDFSFQRGWDQFAWLEMHDNRAFSSPIVISPANPNIFNSGDGGPWTRQQ